MSLPLKLASLTIVTIALVFLIPVLGIIDFIRFWRRDKVDEFLDIYGECLFEDLPEAYRDIWKG